MLKRLLSIEYFTDVNLIKANEEKLSNNPIFKFTEDSADFMLTQGIPVTPTVEKPNTPEKANPKPKGKKFKKQERLYTPEEKEEIR